jgi:hypothetical protein
LGRRGFYDCGGIVAFAKAIGGCFLSLGDGFVMFGGFGVSCDWR